MEEGQIPLQALQVRLVRPEEQDRFHALLRKHNYLGFRKFCGRRLCQVAMLGERWLALLGWQAAGQKQRSQPRQSQPKTVGWRQLLWPA